MRANLSSVVRLAGCFGLTRIHVTGNTRVEPSVARDAARTVEVVRRRSLTETLRVLRADGYHLVGLEQATHSVPLFRYAFPLRAALVIGNERRGL